MESLTTYTVTGKNTHIAWVFKYYLNGLLHSFQLSEGELDSKQIHWLFNMGHFPYKEEQIKSWKAIKNFEIEIGEPDLSFEVFWLKFNHKIKRQDTEKYWKDRKSVV